MSFSLLLGFQYFLCADLMFSAELFLQITGIIFGVNYSGLTVNNHSCRGIFEDAFPIIKVIVCEMLQVKNVPKSTHYLRIVYAVQFLKIYYTENVNMPL